MAYQILNKQGSKNKNTLLQEELNEFILKINSITGKSTQLLARLHQLADKNQADKIISKLNRF